MAVTPTTHLEKSIAGAVQPVTHLEKVIAEYGGGGGGGGSVTPASIVTATGQMTDEQAAATAQNIGIAPLRLTATPTALPDETTLMIGTWSGATWQQVVTAIQNSRLIQVDVTNIGKITLLYNLFSATNASSNAFAFNFGGTLYNVFVKLRIAGSNNQFEMVVINALPETVNVTGTTPTIEPQANTIYNCGEITSLTISNPPATGSYSIVFTSGATATTTTIPATILGLENFAAEANTLYEINVLDSRAVIGSWAVSV